MDMMRDRFIRQTVPVPDGHFSQINNLDKVNINTVVEKRSHLKNLPTLQLVVINNHLNIMQSTKPLSSAWQDSTLLEIVAKAQNFPERLAQSKINPERSFSSSNRRGRFS